MAFEDYGDEYADYNNYYTPPTQEYSYGSYDYAPETDYYSQPEPPPVVYPSAPYESDAYYQAPPSPNQGGESWIPDWMATAGKNLKDYAVNNPKDVIGMLAGGGMGLWGLLRGTEKPSAPDTRGLDAARAQLSAQISQMQGLTADAQARMQKLINGDYGDFQDEAQLRQTVNAQLQDLLARGPGGRTPQEDEQLAQIDQEYAAKHMLGSSLHQKARQAAIDAMNTSAQNRYLQEIQGLQNLATAKANTQRGVYQDTSNITSNQQQQAIQGLGTLANAGLADAQLKYNADKNNADIENARTQQLLTTGGQIFGQSITKDPYAEYLKRSQNKGVRM